MVKVLDANLEEWPYIIEGVLFAHHESRHSSTLILIYNRDTVLPIDIKFSLAEREVNETEVFDEETFEAILTFSTRIRREIHQSTTSNIRKAQDKQKKDFNRRNLSNSEIKVGDHILLRNNRRKDRKGGKFSFICMAWPLYRFQNPTQRRYNVYRMSREILKVKYNLSQFKLYVEEKTTDTDGGTTKFTVAVDNEKPSTSFNTGTSTPLDYNEINYWDSLPNELVEKILLCIIKESCLQTCQTYRNITQMGKRLVYVTLFYVRSLK